MICDVAWCTRTIEKRRWCGRHYQRLRKHGDPEAGGRYRIVGDDVARFWSYVNRSESDSDCWGWSGGHFAEGYAEFRVGTKPTLAHRFAYELLVGPIEQETIDHLCFNRECVNPDHLEPVSRAENGRRGSRAFWDHGWRRPKDNVRVLRRVGKKDSK